MEKKKNVAIITGASSGMGREFAEQISEKYKGIEEFWLIARRKERLEAMQRVMSDKIVRIFVLDLMKTQDLEEFQSVLQKEKPRVCILVNSAGYGMIGKVEELSVKDNVGMVDLNCRSLTAMTHMVLPYIRKGGKIINMASSAAFMPQPGFAVYAASKSYVLSFSRALSQELKGRHISVTAVCPGPVKTEFFDIAETYQAIKLYKKLTMAKADRVVALALRDAAAGKKISVYGPVMKGFRILCKLFPTDFLLQFVH